MAKKLGVNIDHIATLRQARKEKEPDLLTAAKIAIDCGADRITIHLREDRRHIQDHDVYTLASHIPHLNLEMAASDEIVKIACSIKPSFCCLVPEKREELTTEGGLNIIQNQTKLSTIIQQLTQTGINVSLFIDPEKNQIQAAKATGAGWIEIHTGKYANAKDPIQQAKELRTIETAARFAADIGLHVNAGHGLNYDNVKNIAKIPEIEELNIGHSIISRALFVGFKTAVLEIKQLI